MEFRELLNTPGPVLLDGGMGTMLQARGLSIGEWPELAALEHPDWLEDIHRAYVEAGAQILCANTFGANREKLGRTGRTVEEVVPPSVEIARRAARGRALVALDVGPTGQLLEPTGTLRFEEAVDIFAQTVRAGVQAGADLILIETMTDLQEARAALLAAKENSSLPVIVTMQLPGLRPGLCGSDPGGDGGRCHRSELLPGPPGDAPAGAGADPVVHPAYRHQAQCGPARPRGRGV